MRAVLVRIDGHTPLLALAQFPLPADIGGRLEQFRFEAAALSATALRQGHPGLLL
jgi:hypothetical protein